MNKSLRSFKQSAQAGFTLIELIVVIVILGILAATAIPKFIDMAKQAREAKVSAAEGALQSASSIAHAQWLVDGVAGSSVTLEGQAVAMTNGYPNSLGIKNAISLTGYTVTGGTDATTPLVLAESSGRTNCQVTFTTSAAANTAPVIASEKNGC